MNHAKRVAVIGAGISGLICARRLLESGVDVEVFEKSRGVGGRTSTRRTDTGHLFDHGAPHVRAGSTAFADQIDAWVREGLLARRSLGPIEFFVGTAGMNGVCRHLARDLSIRFNTRVGRLKCGSRGDELFDEKGESLGRFDFVISTMPAPQLEAIAPEGSPVKSAAESVIMQPRWVALLGFANPVAADRPAALTIEFQEDSFELYRTESNRVGADWVIHAPRRWSAACLELPAETVARELLVCAAAALETRDEPAYLAAHRWRYAFADEPLGQPFLIDGQRRLAACGDWCLGWTVESAWESGRACAEAVRASLG